MTIKRIVNKHLKVLAESLENKWTGSTYEVLKLASPTEKGDWGEDTTTDIVNKILKIEAKRINKGKGPFDILLTVILKTIEHKLATEDTNGGFQFNGLRKDNKYDFAFLLGVSPEKLWFQMYRKKDLKLTTSMTSGGSDSFKKSIPLKKMIPLTAKNLMDMFEAFDLV